MDYKIVSWNVNGIRACNKKGFKEWVLSNDFDIVGIQENKAQRASLSEKDINIPGYRVFWAEAQKKGYSGVSVWVKDSVNVVSVSIGINEEQFDNEGRTIILETDQFYLINGYFPNGREDHSRVDYKLDYSYKILELAKEMRLIKPVIICGDINTAHNEIDLANPSSNRNTTGFLVREREYLNSLEKNDFVDVFRLKNPTTVVYSWWSYRTAARLRNVGWRIDYFILDKSLISKVKDIKYANEIEGSDHCPVILALST